MKATLFQCINEGPLWVLNLGFEIIKIIKTEVLSNWGYAVLRRVSRWSFAIMKHNWIPEYRCYKQKQNVDYCTLNNELYLRV